MIFGGLGLLKFAGKYWQYIVLALFLVGLYFYHAGLLHTIEEQSAEIVALNKDNATLEANEQRLKDEIKMQNGLIVKIEKKQTMDQKRIIELALKENAARAEVAEMKKKFREHDLDRLSLSKPKWMTKIINRGTAKVLKELEDLTDPALIEAEVAKP